jgi:hypothetical protein
LHLEILQKLRNLFGIPSVQKVQQQQKQPDKEAFTINEPYMEGMMGWYNRSMQMSRDRRSIYYDMEQISDFVLGGSALEMYTEDAFPFNQERGSTTWLSSPNSKVIQHINELNRRIDIETLIQALTFTVAQYGDDFEYLTLGENEGILSVRQVPPYMLTRIEDEHGHLLGFTPGIVDYMPDRNATIPTPLSRPWDILHTRLCTSYTRVTGHGSSMLMPVRYIWRQLKIMMDSMVLYRFTRGPDRMVYYVDVGTNPPEQQMRILNNWKLYIKKKQHFNPDGGSFDQEWNPESIDEDIFWPTSKGNESKVERLPGASNVGDIADVQLYVNMFFAGLRIPKAFMGFEGEIMAREVLPYQSIRYANVAYRLQRAVLAALSRLYQIHLTLQGFDMTKEENSFKVHTSTISHLYDVAKAELLQAKMDIMKTLLDFGDQVQLNKNNWLRYILRTYLDMEDNIIQSLMPAQMHSRDDEDMEDLPGNERSAIDQALRNNPETMERLQNLKKMAPYFNPSVSSRDSGDKFEDIASSLQQENADEESFHARVRELAEQNWKEKSNGKQRHTGKNATTNH